MVIIINEEGEIKIVSEFKQNINVFIINHKNVEENKVETRSYNWNNHFFYIKAFYNKQNSSKGNSIIHLTIPL